MRRLFPLLAFAFPLVLGSVAASVGDAAGSDVAWVRYLNGAEFEGSIDGSCESPGLRFHEATPVEVRLLVRNARLVTFETETNDSYALSAVLGYPVWSQLGMRQWANETPLAGGEWRVSWTADGDGILYALPGSAPLNVSLGGNRLWTGPVVSGLPAGLWYPYVGPDGVGFWGQEGLGGPTRLVRHDAPTLTGRGGVILLMNDARLEGPGGYAKQLAPFSQVQQHVGLDGVASYWRVHYTHAALIADEAHVTVDAGRVDLACNGLQAAFEGDATFHHAQGRLQRGDHKVDFTRSELGVSGVLDLQEAFLTTDGPSPRTWVDSQGAGSFSAVGLDFAAVDLGPAPTLTPQEIGLLALIVAALGAVALQGSRLVGVFYSRFNEGGALHHAKRAQLLDLVRHQPGLILRDVVAQTGHRYGVVRHHARVLETVGLVKVLRVGKEVHLYPRTHSLAQARRGMLLERDEPVKFLVDRARSAPVERRRAGRELQERYGLSRMGAWKVIRRAVSSGLLRAQPAPGGDTLHPAGLSPMAGAPAVSSAPE